MESNQPTASSQNVYVSKPPSNKLPVALSFLAGCLMFFLPFVEIKCNGSTMAKATGIDLVTGTDMKPAGALESLNNFGDSFSNNENTTVETKKENKLEANMFAMAALGLGVLGLLIAFLSSGNKLTGVIAVLAIAALIALMVDVKSQIKNDPQTLGSDATDVKITAEFTIGYFLSLVAFLIAAIVSFKKRRIVQTAVSQPGSFPVTSSNVPPGDSSTAGGGGIAN
jgi:hypothetical protein